MAQAPKKARLDPIEQEAKARGISPDALRAFYRQRSESLQNSHTVRGEQSAQMQTQQDTGIPANKRPAQGVLEYVISALQGTPGYLNK